MCELCEIYEERVIHTTVYYEDDICIVLDCHTHKVPMAVLKFHTATPTEIERQHMYSVMAKFGLSENDIRGPNSIPDHFHLHEK